MVTFFACYDYSEELYLIELGVDCPPSEIEWMEMAVPEEGVKPSDWQAPYLEQYLNEDGTEKLCDLYEEPEGGETSRVAFFLFKSEGDTLKTPWGTFELTGGQPLPERLSSIIEFEEED